MSKKFKAEETRRLSAEVALEMIEKKFNALKEENIELKAAHRTLFQQNKKLLGSSTELSHKLRDLHNYTVSKVKSYTIKDSMYFSVINLLANGLHSKL